MRNSPDLGRAIDPCTIGQSRGIVGARGVGDAEVALGAASSAPTAASPASSASSRTNHWTKHVEGLVRYRHVSSFDKFLARMLALS